MIHVDVAGLQPHQQLLALRPGDELHVEGVVGDEGEDGWRDLVGVGLDLFLVESLDRRLVSWCRHLFEDVLLGEGPAGEVPGQRVGADNSWTKWRQSLRGEMSVQTW